MDFFDRFLVAWKLERSCTRSYSRWK